MTDGLFQNLSRRANHRGLVVARDVTLLEDLHVSRAELGAALLKLENAGLVETLSPLPFLVVRLKTWPGERASEADSESSAYSAIQLLNKQLSNSSYRHAGAHWPIDGALLAEILETLGETDGKSFEKAVELYSPHVIRKALDRVRRAKGIRKSRTALFRHLLPRLVRDERRFDQAA
jgi:hypothetical protein